jgi:S-adenosylmethionine:tRNA ribosyltransferase-isomerase
MKRSDFNFALPPGRIAQAPATPRDHSRLMVLNRDDGRIDHRRFHELPSLLRAGDVLVMNTTRVFPARLRGQKRSGGKAELLLLAPEGSTPGDFKEAGRRWLALVRGLSSVGGEVLLPDDLRARLEGRQENGEWVVSFSRDGVREYLERFGEMPLPPYIKRAQRTAADSDNYQTVYAREEGSVAAPTAGFHFTDRVFAELRERQLDVVEITLHVGWGTFRPVRSETIAEHMMLPEVYRVSDESARRLRDARTAGRRVVAIGTTSVRTLESAYQANRFEAGSTAATRLFIYPGYRYQAVDALITNFHLPHSTPLLLASAFYGNMGNMGTVQTAQHSASFGPSPFSLRVAYETAIREGYRFYSYGDAMLIQ